MSLFRTMMTPLATPEKPNYLRISTGMVWHNADFVKTLSEVGTPWLHCRAELDDAGSHGSHSYELTDFGIDADVVRGKFAPYIAAYDATG
jgi:hypothetical protein